MCQLKPYGAGAHNCLGAWRAFFETCHVEAFLYITCSRVLQTYLEAVNVMLDLICNVTVSVKLYCMLYSPCRILLALGIPYTLRFSLSGHSGERRKSFPENPLRIPLKQ